MINLVRDVKKYLQTDRFGRVIRGYDSITSTNTYALRWAAEGAEEGSVVVADFQTEGRGRFGRPWIADQGVNLLFSTILHPPLSPEQLGLISLSVGLAVAETVEYYSKPAIPAIKWPNDILINGKKCCGLLLESVIQSRDSPTSTVVIGIGLNVNQVVFPADITLQATSLLLELGRFVPRAILFSHLLFRLEENYYSLFDDDGRTVRHHYLQRLHGINQYVNIGVAGSNTRIAGKIMGISETGGLILQTENGIKTLYAGEVTFV